MTRRAGCFRAPRSLAGLRTVAFLAVLLMGGCGVTRFEADPGAANAAFERAEAPPADAWTVSDKEGLPRVKFGGPKPDDAGGWVEGVTRESWYEPMGEGWVKSERYEIRTGTMVVKSSPRLLYGQWRRDGTLAEALKAAGEGPWWNEGALGSIGNTAPFSLSFEITGAAEDATPRGVLIHISGVAPGQHDGAVTDELARRGWVVIRTWGWEYTPPKRGKESEKEQGAVWPPATPARLDTLIGVFAQDSDEIGTMFANGVAAALAWVDREMPRTAGVPVVLTGYSLGAMVTPTVAARLGDRVRAVVLVGGGANVVGIAATTDLWGGLVTIRDYAGKRRLTREELEYVEPRYLEKARLDPYHTAPLLADRPVLMLQASKDGYVLPRYGDLLWERLGKPERWVRNSGHALMFYWLDDSAGDVADWVERAAGAGGRGGGGVDSVR